MRDELPPRRARNAGAAEGRHDLSPRSPARIRTFWYAPAAGPILTRHGIPRPRATTGPSALVRPARARADARRPGDQPRDARTLGGHRPEPGAGARPHDDRTVDRPPPRRA